MATKILVAEIGPIDIFALRLAIGLPVLAVLLVARRQRLQFSRADALPLGLAGAIFTIHFLIQATALTSTTATNSGWIIAVSPLALAVLSFAFLGERLAPRALAGIAVATTGILLLVSRGRLTDLEWLQSTGDWLILASAFTWAAYTVVTRDLARRRDPLAVTFAILLVTATLTGLLFAVSGDPERMRALSPQGVAAAFYLGIPALALGNWFWQQGVANVGAARAGIYLYVEPLATLTLAVPLLGEPFGPIAALGGALVLTGVAMGQRDRRA